MLVEVDPRLVARGDDTDKFLARVQCYMNKTVVARSLAGDFSPRVLKWYLVALFGIAIFLLAVAVVAYAMRNGFSLLQTQISPLGSHEENPTGWPWFSAAFWLLAAGSVPILNFYRKILQSLKIRARKVIVVLFVAAIPGVFMIGFIPPDFNIWLHRILAGLAFGGIGLGFFFLGIELINRKYKNHDDSVSTRLIMPFIAFICFIITAIISQVYGMMVGHYPAENTWYAWALWEWLLFFSIMVMFAFASMPLLQVAGENTNQDAEIKRS